MIRQYHLFVISTSMLRSKFSHSITLKSIGVLFQLKRHRGENSRSACRRRHIGKDHQQQFLMRIQINRHPSEEPVWKFPACHFDIFLFYFRLVIAEGKPLRQRSCHTFPFDAALMPVQRQRLSQCL